MKTHSQQPEAVSHTIQGKNRASKQASMESVLQKYAQSVESRELRVESVQRQADNELDDELLQGKFEAAENGELKMENENPLSTLNSQFSTNKTGIPDTMKSGFENMSGFSFDDVRVHYNSPKPAQLQALAYTQGSEVHIAPGQERHLGHELGHVVQQKQGRVKPTMQMKGVSVNDDEGLEREADNIGRKSLGFIRYKRNYKTIDIYNHNANNRVLQGLFTFDVAPDTEFGFVITNFKYIRTSISDYLIGKKEGMHTMADAVKNLLFIESEKYPIEFVINRLVDISDTYLNLPGNSLLMFADLENQKKIEERDMYISMMYDVLNEINSIDVSNEYAAYVYKEKIGKFLNYFEIFANYNPLVNLDNDNNTGRGESKWVEETRRYLQVRHKGHEALSEDYIPSILKIYREELKQRNNEIIKQTPKEQRKGKIEELNASSELEVLAYSQVLVGKRKEIIDKLNEGDNMLNIFGSAFMNLFDENSVEVINNCESLGEIRDYLPWLNIWGFIQHRFGLDITGLDYVLIVDDIITEFKNILCRFCTDYVVREAIKPCAETQTFSPYVINSFISLNVKSHFGVIFDIFNQSLQQLPTQQLAEQVANAVAQSVNNLDINNSVGLSLENIIRYITGTCITHLKGQIDNIQEIPKELFEALENFPINYESMIKQIEDSISKNTMTDMLDKADANKVYLNYLKTEIMELLEQNNNCIIQAYWRAGYEQ